MVAVAAIDILRPTNVAVRLFEGGQQYFCFSHHLGLMSTALAFSVLQR